MAFGDFLCLRNGTGQNSKKPAFFPAFLSYMGGRWDLNPRPLEPQSSALTN